MTGEAGAPPPTAGEREGRLDAAAERSAPGSLADVEDDASRYAVPDGEAPAARCPYCGRPFARSRLRRLHVGEWHRDECTDAERTAYEAAYDAESDDLFRYQLTLVAGLVALFFGFVYVYAVVFTL